MSWDLILMLIPLGVLVAGSLIGLLADVIFDYWPKPEVTKTLTCRQCRHQVLAAGRCSTTGATQRRATVLAAVAT